MTPWILLDTAPIPGGGGTLRLLQRGHEFVIRLDDGAELMGTRSGGSEEALARIGLAGVSARPSARVLIGGLGMGFTLRVTLAMLQPSAKVVVAELVPAVVRWAEGPLATIHAGSLADARVVVAEGDVGAMIRASPAPWDAILLDTDNGPDALTSAGNGALYSAAGLRASFASLTPGGALAVWSAAPDAAFTRRLSAAGFSVETRTARAHAGRGARYTVWVATRPGHSAPRRGSE